MSSTSEEDVTADPEDSARRQNLGKWGWLVVILGAGLTIFQLYTAVRGTYVTLIQGPIHLGTAAALIFLLYPARRSKMGIRSGVPWFDIVLAAVALSCNLYIVFNYERFISEAMIFGFTALDISVAATGIVLLLEATRRSVGVPIVIVALLALAYEFFGAYMPVFEHPGVEGDDLFTEMFFSSSGVFGIPIQVSSTYIFLFLLFGVILMRSGVGRFLDDLAYSITGGFTGGTAKTAIVASAFQGTISGSSVANTVASGSFTIPMMKRAGFKPAFAGATEAAASTGGQIMPPVMGAAAFIMASYTGISYRNIIIMAAIPALLYFAGVFLGTHFVAKREGIYGVPRSQLPRLRSLLSRLDMILPIVAMVYLLMSGYTPTFAALAGIVTAFAISFIRKDTRPTHPREVGDILVSGAKVALPVIAACGTAGIVAGTVVKTGLGSKLAGGLIDIAQGHFWLILVLTMIACLILGMGLPTTANYIVTATIAAPVIVKFGAPVIASHLFVFYFGVMADITPPVCLAAYAAAGIARANPMTVGVNSIKLAVAAFIIPYMFVANPVLVLQDASWGGVTIAVITALLGMVGVSAGIMGFFVARSTVFETLALIAGGVALIVPSLPSSLVGLCVIAAVGLLQYRRRGVTPTGAPDLGSQNSLYLQEP